jgi:ATP-dependent Lon protease
MVSALTGKPARHDVAMTGEITLRGKILPIGGVKEKLLAAHRFGLKTIILSKDNEKDLMDVPEEVREDLTIHTVETIDEVLSLALENVKTEETPAVETPQIWTTDTTPADISVTVE